MLRWGWNPASTLPSRLCALRRDCVYLREGCCWAMHRILQVLQQQPLWPLPTCWTTSKDAGGGTQGPMRKPGLAFYIYMYV